RASAQPLGRPWKLPGPVDHGQCAASEIQPAENWLAKASDGGVAGSEPARPRRPRTVRERERTRLGSARSARRESALRSRIRPPDARIQVRRQSALWVDAAE